MMIFTDHFYEKGHSHEVCQDYALSQQNKDYAFFVVSDGCGSAKNSEIGSMVMAHALKSALELTWYRETPLDVTKHGTVQKVTLNKADEVRKSLELFPESLYATLLLGFYDKKTKEFGMAAWGDGTFVVLYEDGDYDIHNISYENNAPYYMVYNQVGGSMDGYVEHCGGRATATDTGKDKNHNLIWSGSRLLKSPSVIKFSPKREKAVKGIIGFSDGIESCGKLHYESVIQKCLDFKNINGTYIQRKGKRLLKEFEKEGYSPYDDFSMAGIIIK